MEKEIGYVNPDRYKYFNLMKDCHKLFEITTNFITVITSRGMYLRRDDDVMLMFHKYKKDLIL